MKKHLLVLCLFVSIGFSSVAAQAAGPITEWEWIVDLYGTHYSHKIIGVYHGWEDAGAAFNEWYDKLNVRYPYPNKATFANNTGYWTKRLYVYPNSPPFYYPYWTWVYFIWPKDGVLPPALEAINDPAQEADNS